MGRSAAVLATLASAVAICLPLHATSRGEGDAWWQVSTPDATVVGDADPSHVGDISAGLGRFRAVIASVYPRALLRPAAPVVVVLFRDRESGAAYRPVFEGRPVEVGGTYLPGVDQHLITISTDRPASDWQALFHEYTHLILQQTMRQAPPWFDEGLAEYHSTVVFSGSGRLAEVGRLHEAHVRLLRREAMLPLVDLLSAAREDPLYNEGDRRGMFYAQSWLLVHYLLSGDRGRAGEVFAYLDEVDRGATVEQALDRAFKSTPALLEKELRDYLQQPSFETRSFAIPPADAAGEAPVAALTLADAEAWRGELLLRLDRRQEAREHLERALGLDGQHARALSALGRLSWLEQQPSESRSLLARAAALGPYDPVVQVRFARALLDQARAATRPAEPARDDLRAAEDAARRALRTRPDMAEAHGLLATAALARGDAVAALSDTQRAIDSAPSRDDLRLLLAHAQIAAGRWPEASALLRLLADRGQTARLRSEAARLLEDKAPVKSEKRAGAARRPQ